MVVELLFVGGVIAGLFALAHWFVAHRATLIEGLARHWQRLIGSAPMQRLRVRYPRIWTFVASRFARGEYLGLHLTVGLTISFVSLWTFVSLTEDVLHHDPITLFDVATLDWIRAHTTPTGHAFARAVSAVGSPRVMVSLGVIGAVVLAIRREWLFIEGWVIALLGGEALNVFLKRLIQRPRPMHSVISSAQSWSFPSGHAMESLIGYGMLAYVVFVLVAWPRRRRVGIALAATVLILLIGSSRIYLGVHYVSDVLGGYAAGLIWLAACISGLEVARRWREAPIPEA
ncbi:MAG TPA: phosphatase PAP2 family protein [Gemmatimonadales bacterium]|jgi:membrane-associated phospholipid phosphatase|nr:phosphatase PAP2 family protein [Gemmatimonadales bacterium]